MEDMAREVLVEDEEEGAEFSDPLVTHRPYPWWRPPPEMANLTKAEQIQLLKNPKPRRTGGVGVVF
jgi:hypothetical protein